MSTKIIDHLVRIRVGTNSLGLRGCEHDYIHNAVEASSYIRLAELHRHSRILRVTKRRNPNVTHDQIEDKSNRQHDGQEEQTKRAAAATARFAAAALRTAGLCSAALLLRAGMLLLGHFLLFLLNGSNGLFLLLHLLLHLLFRVLLISLLSHFLFVQKDNCIRKHGYLRGVAEGRNSVNREE